MNAADIKEKAFVEIKKIESTSQLEEARIRYLGRDGLVNQLFAEIPELPREEDRKKAGIYLNEIKLEIEEALAQRDRQLKKLSAKELEKVPFDITASGIQITGGLGSIHPLTQLRQFVLDTFSDLGFEEVSAPHIETDDYNFGLLNVLADHPARDLWDTLYLEDGRLLRTHTSNMQVREMKKRLSAQAGKPPIRVMTFDRCFRYENLDPQHSHTFTQFEILYVDHHVSMANLRFLSDYFLKRFFGEKTKTRFRPKYYPFVEPGVGVDALGPNGWIEIAGAGLVHPQVLRNGGIDPNQYSGLAWGFGPDRMLMAKLGIDDIRSFYEGDLRFLKQF